MLQGPSRGLCSAQTSGSPMTLSSATAAGSAPKAGVNLECVEAGPSIQAPGSARDVAPALGAQANAISNPNPKQTQHGNDHLVVVKVQDAVSDIVTTGTAQCPFTAYSNPKTTHEAPPPAADLGAGEQKPREERGQGGGDRLAARTAGVQGRRAAHQKHRLHSSRRRQVPATRANYRADGERFADLAPPIWARRGRAGANEGQAGEQSSVGAGLAASLWLRELPAARGGHGARR